MITVFSIFQIINTLLALMLILGLFIGLIFLQKYICKNLNIKFGLILPIIHLIPLILIFINTGFFDILYFVDKNNTLSSKNNSSTILNLNLNSTTFILGSIVQIINIVFIFIIPTLVYYLIYRYYKKKRNQLQNN